MQSFPWQEEGPSCTWAKPRAAIVFIAPSGRRKNRFPCQKEALASTDMALGPSDPSGRKRMRASPDQYRYVTEKTSPVAPTKAHPQSASNPRPTGGRRWHGGRLRALSVSLFLCNNECCCAECLVIVITTSVLSRFQNCFDMQSFLLLLVVVVPFVHTLPRRDYRRDGPSHFTPLWNAYFYIESTGS